MLRIALTALALVLVASCAKDAPDSGPTVLMTSDDESIVMDSDASASRARGPQSIAFKPPRADGTWAYRLVLEASGQQRISVSTDHDERDPVEQSFLLEAEYGETPTQAKVGVNRGAYLLRLDALHFRVLQSGGPPRVIELADDRMRILVGDKPETDLEGAQPKEGLTPRMLIHQIIGLVIHDDLGNPVSVQLRGRPKVRNFLNQFPLREAMAFSRVPRPKEPISPGYNWQGQRFPANAIGGLGLELDIEYSLTGYADVDGVRCAWILLKGVKNGTDIPSAQGFVFDRVKAEIRGEAWIELDTGRLRRMVIFDESRAAYTKGKEPSPVTDHRLRYKGRMMVELIDPNELRETWADGKPRFEIK